VRTDNSKKAQQQQRSPERALHPLLKLSNRSNITKILTKLRNPFSRLAPLVTLTAVFYCNGANCPSKRIRRNSYFYVAGNNQYHWCHQCFTELKEDGINLPDLVIKKSELGRNKRKNDDQPEESWVACDTCGRWIHQICGLFNTRQNKDQRSMYECPKCTIVTRKKKGSLGPTSQTKTATDLPRTRLSEFIEHHIRQKSIDKYKELAAERAQSEGISLEEATKTFDNAGAITIRQVTSMDRNIATREGFKKRYKFKVRMKSRGAPRET
jgi:E1A/CREB-binding protein